MFDTMTATKILGAFCGALLTFLLATWAADALYATGGGGHGEGDHAAAGYVIEVAGAEDSHGEEEAEVEAPDFGAILASADVAAGEKVFGKKCKSCHKAEDGKNATGPYLFGVVDREIAGVADFKGYSGTMKELGGTWTPEQLNAFLTKPKDLVPGTKMSFAGLKKIEDRANLVAYLATLQ